MTVPVVAVSTPVSVALSVVVSVPLSVVVASVTVVDSLEDVGGVSVVVV